MKTAPLVEAIYHFDSRQSKQVIAENWRIAEELKDNKGFVFEVSSSFLLFFSKIIIIKNFFFSVSSGQGWKP